MKRLFTLLAAVLLTATIRAQAPEKMSYQAVIRDSEGLLVTSSNIGMQISILHGDSEGTALYVERHFPPTNENGLVTLEIGSGTVVSGTFAGIDWTGGPYFLKTETDLAGGANYTISGTSQLLSVPYAMHSRSSEILTGEITEDQISDLKDYITVETDPTWSGAANQTGTISRTGNVGIGTASPTSPLHVEGKVRIADGTQGNNKMLGSDAGGTASWVGAPGVDFVEAGSGGTISTTQAGSVITSVTLTTPGPGYIIVHASGSIYHSYTSSGSFMLRVKVSGTSSDVSENPGIQFIRKGGFPTTTGTNMYPFSVSRVFEVASAGNHRFYLNAWHQVVNGTLSLSDHTFIGVYVPHRY